MRIGLDLDDCLFPWTEHAIAACVRAGVCDEGVQVTRWGMHEDLGISSAEFWEVIHHEYRKGMLLSPPYEGVRAALSDLQWYGGHTVHLATARGFEGPLASLVRMHTVEWLTANSIPHDSLTFTRDKTVLDVDVFLDDGIHNVDALLAAGIPAYLRDQPHNRIAGAHLNHVRVADLAEFAEVAVA